MWIIIITAQLTLINMPLPDYMVLSWISMASELKRQRLPVPVESVSYFLKVRETFFLTLAKVLPTKAVLRFIVSQILKLPDVS